MFEKKEPQFKIRKIILKEGLDIINLFVKFNIYFFIN